MLTIDRVSFQWDSEDQISRIGPISFKADRGELIGLFGRSGAGKSTLLRLIAGEILPHEGEVQSSGHQIVYHDQNQKLIPWLSAKSNALVNLNRAASDSEQQILEISGVNEFGHRDATRLSGGQRARVALARSLIENADVLLLDEPFAGVDAFSQERLIDRVFSTSDGRLLVLTSHDPGVLLQVSSRIVCLVRHDGRMVGKEFAIPSSLIGLGPSDRRESKDYINVIRELQGMLYE